MSNKKGQSKEEAEYSTQFKEKIDNEEYKKILEKKWREQEQRQIQQKRLYKQNKIKRRENKKQMKINQYKESQQYLLELRNFQIEQKRKNEEERQKKVMEERKKKEDQLQREKHLKEEEQMQKLEYQRKLKEEEEKKRQQEEKRKELEKIEYQRKLKEEKEIQIKDEEMRKEKQRLERQKKKRIQEEQIKKMSADNVKFAKFVSEETQKKQKIIKEQNLQIKKQIKIEKSKNGEKKIRIKAKIQTNTCSLNLEDKNTEFIFRDKNVSKVWQKIQNIEQKSPEIAHLICNEVMSEPVTETQIKQSENIKKSLKEKALQNPESVENMVWKLAEELQKSGIPIIMSEHSTAQSQISLKTLTEGFMQNTVKVFQTIPNNDPSCPFVFEDLEDPQQFQNFSAFYKLKVAKETGLDPDKIFINCVTKGSIKVEWTTNDSDKLNESYETQPELEKKLKIHRFFEFFHLSPEDFDHRGNIQFNESKNDVQTRGGWPYYQPVKCKRYGLNVSKKYDNGNDKWLNMKGQKGQWAVAFHGVRAPKAFNPGGKTTLNLIMDGRESNSMLKGFGGQAYQHTFPLNGNTTEHVGFGIYCTPHIQVSLSGYTNHSDEYALVFQCRVNPKKIKVCSNNVYWVINDTKDIRPYGIILMKNNVARQYPSVEQQFTRDNKRGEQFVYQNFKKGIQQYINSY